MQKSRQYDRSRKRLRTRMEAPLDFREKYDLPPQANPIVLFAGRERNSSYDGSWTWGFKLNRTAAGYEVLDFADVDFVALYTLTQPWLYLIPTDELLHHFTPHPNNPDGRWCLILRPNGTPDSQHDLGYEAVLVPKGGGAWMRIEEFAVPSPDVSLNKWFRQREVSCLRSVPKHAANDSWR